jgi:hypothetical protein
MMRAAQRAIAYRGGRLAQHHRVTRSAWPADDPFEQSNGFVLLFVYHSGG